MYGRGGLDRFKKAQTLEPFSVTANSTSKTSAQPPSKPITHPSLRYSVTSDHQPQPQQQPKVTPESGVPDATATPVTQVGGGQTNWQPPDWAIEPRAGFYYLEVLKDGVVLDHINLDKRKHIFGRQFHTCDFVLDHQSVSRQHAAVVPHKNGRSLRFAASTRTYILRKNEAVLFPPPPSPSEIKLPPPPDPSDEEALVAYNTIINRYGLNISGNNSESSSTSGHRNDRNGVDVETEPGPVGVEGGSLVGKYESLVKTTVIPKGKEESSKTENYVSPVGMTDKLREVLIKVKSAPKGGGIYDDVFGESVIDKAGSSWASSDSKATPKIVSHDDAKGVNKFNTSNKAEDEDDDLFGD
ncbi:unnamed protein product [Rhodiola kirilowii]